MGTTVTAQNVLDVARNWLHYSEYNGKFKEILDVYNAYRPLARRTPIKLTDEWCDCFVSAVAIKAGAVDLIGTEIGCEWHVNIFKSKGIWLEDGKIKPLPGDIILFNWDTKVQPNDGRSDHIGYVDQVIADNITTIEGNMNREVGRRMLKVGDGRIRGYARPKYAVEQPKKPAISIDEVAKEVLHGKWGNGIERKNALILAGFDYDAVQKRVNELLKHS